MTYSIAAKKSLFTGFLAILWKAYTEQEKSSRHFKKIKEKEKNHNQTEFILLLSAHSVKTSSYKA